MGKESRGQDAALGQGGFILEHPAFLHGDREFASRLHNYQRLHCAFIPRALHTTTPFIVSVCARALPKRLMGVCTILRTGRSGPALLCHHGRATSCTRLDTAGRHRGSSSISPPPSPRFLSHPAVPQCPAADAALRVRVRVRVRVRARVRARVRVHALAMHDKHD